MTGAERDLAMKSGLAASLGCLSAQERDALDRLLMTDLWVPLAGPQTDAYDSPADILLYGGAAGGGKTDLLLGLAMTRHRRSILFRREFAQLRAVEDRAAELIGDRGRFSGARRAWRLNDGRLLEFGAVQRPDDVRKYQGRAHDLKAFDEITHFTEAQFRFLIGWNRASYPGQRVRVVAAGNPPTDAQGAWVLRYWAPWLDPTYPKPARSGEVRWFATVDGVEREWPDGVPFQAAGMMITPQSRSFVRARISDNPYLMASGYLATLQALPEPLRTQMLSGEFASGIEDDPWQVIPTAWVLAAQARWVPEGPAMPYTAIGVDVARGGRDRTVIVGRKGTWFSSILSIAGDETPDGPSVAGRVIGFMDGSRGGAAVPIQVDVIGVGAAVYDALQAAGIRAVPLNGAKRSLAQDKSGQLGFANKRAEWYWRLREALDPDFGDGLALPPDRELLRDLVAPRWKLTGRGIQIESKEDMMKRLGHSPDKADGVVYAHAEAGSLLPGLLTYLRQQQVERN